MADTGGHNVTLTGQRVGSAGKVVAACPKMMAPICVIGMAVKSAASGCATTTGSLSLRPSAVLSV